MHSAPNKAVKYNLSGNNDYGRKIINEDNVYFKIDIFLSTSPINFQNVQNEMSQTYP